MKVCFRKSDGVYCDSADSFVGDPGDDKFIQGPNVMGRYGGKVEDYIVVDIEQPTPCLCKLDGGKVELDTTKAAELQAKEDMEVERQLRMDYLLDRITARTATLKEVQEYLSIRKG